MSRTSVCVVFMVAIMAMLTAFAPAGLATSSPVTRLAAVARDLGAMSAPAQNPRASGAAWLEDLDALVQKILDEHPDPYRLVGAEAFQEEVANLRENIFGLADHQIVVGLARLAALLGDGHTEIGLNQGATGFRRLPVAMNYFGDELRVYGAYPPFTDLIGARVTAIGNVSIDEAFTRVAPLISRDNDQELLLTVPVYLQIPEVLNAVGLAADVDSARFRVEFDDGGARDVTLPASKGLDDDAFVRARDESTTPLTLQVRALFWHEVLNDGATLYIRMFRCLDDEEQTMAQFAEEIFAAIDRGQIRRVVFDLRNNRGGNYLLMRPFLEGIRQRPELDRPGALYTILDRETFSAAAIFALQLKQASSVTLVGEPSRSAPNGSDNSELFRLPHSGLIATYTDRVRRRAPELAGVDVLAVDLPVENSFADYRAGRDRVLEAILARPLPGSRPEAGR